MRLENRLAAVCNAFPPPPLPHACVLPWLPIFTGILDNHTIFVVKGRAATVSSTPPAAAAAAAAAPAPAAATASSTAAAANPWAALLNPSGTGGVTGGTTPAASATAGGLGGMSGMAAQMMRNPQMMQQMMNNPMVQSIMDNPEVCTSSSIVCMRNAGFNCDV